MPSEPGDERLSGPQGCLCVVNWFPGQEYCRQCGSGALLAGEIGSDNDVLVDHCEHVVGFVDLWPGGASGPCQLPT